MKTSEVMENASPTGSGESVSPAGQRIIHSLGVVIATVGRKEVVEQTIASLARRKNVPSLVIVVGASQNDLPVLPKTYFALRNKLQNPEVPMAELVEVVERDVAISAKIFQLVNSAFFGLRRRLSEHDRAQRSAATQTTN